MSDTHLSRDEHLQLVCGTGSGPDLWRQGQERQAALIEQTRAIAGLIDELGRHEMSQLDDELAQQILPIIDEHIDYFSDPFSRDETAAAFEHLREALCVLGRLMESGSHAQDVIRQARVLLDGADGVPDPLLYRPVWPQGFDTRSRHRLLEYLNRVTRLAWATPQATEQPVLVGLVTGAQRELEAWRELRMLPAIAQRERRPILNALRYWLEHEARRDHKNRVYARYFVVTSGRRVTYGEDLGERMRAFQRLISRWASISRQQWGVEVVFRGTELTLDDVGAHVHANVLVDPLEAMGHRWGSYTAAMRRHFHAWVRDNGRVADPAEIVKYAIKPTEIERQVLDFPDKSERLARVAWLYKAFYKARLVAPLGELKELWAGIEARKLKPVIVGNVPRLVPKWTPNPSSKNPDHSQENVLVGHILSNRVHTPWAEPSVLVLGYTSTPTTKAGADKLSYIESLAAEARAAWDTNSKGVSPEAALAVAQAWKSAEKDADARKVWAFRGASGASAGGRGRAEGISPQGEALGGVPRSIVHTSGVTVLNFLADHSDSQAGPPPGYERLPNGSLFDLETGEIFEGIRSRRAAAG